MMITLFWKILFVGKGKNIPGWNLYVKALDDEYRFIFHLHRGNGGSHQAEMAVSAPSGLYFHSLAPIYSPILATFLKILLSMP